MCNAEKCVTGLINYLLRGQDYGQEEDPREVVQLDQAYRHDVVSNINSKADENAPMHEQLGYIFLLREIL